MRWLLLLLLLVPVAEALEIPQPTGFVNDYAGMIDAPAELEAFLQQIEQNTTVEIVVYTIASLEGESLEMYANDVFREWGVGKKDVNNGILILLVKDTRDIRIEVGLGLEGVVTDGTAGLLIRNRMTPLFRQGLFTEGIALAAQDIVNLAANDPSTVSAYEKAQRPNYDWIVVLVLLAGYVIAMTYASIKHKDNKKEKQKQQRSASNITFMTAFILSMYVSSSILWFVLFFIIMANVATNGYAGFFFLPGGPRGPGGGGMGGFGGGFSGGGGASGGW